jgi:hypothetical protein
MFRRLRDARPAERVQGTSTRRSTLDLNVLLNYLRESLNRQLPVFLAWWWQARRGDSDRESIAAEA